VLPASLKQEVIQAAHGQLLSGQSGISERAERINQFYYWPNMGVDICQHIEKRTTCQERRFQHIERSEILTPLPLCTEPIQMQKMVMCMADAFTKYSEFVAIENKVS
jgi:hypothetical protein